MGSRPGRRSVTRLAVVRADEAAGRAGPLSRTAAPPAGRASGSADGWSGPWSPSRIDDGAGEDRRGCRPGSCRGRAMSRHATTRHFLSFRTRPVRRARGRSPVRFRRSRGAARRRGLWTSATGSHARPARGGPGAAVRTFPVPDRYMPTKFLLAATADTYEKKPHPPPHDSRVPVPPSLADQSHIYRISAGQRRFVEGPDLCGGSAATADRGLLDSLPGPGDGLYDQNRSLFYGGGYEHAEAGTGCTDP